MFCTKCGAQLPDDCLFCIACGAPVDPLASQQAQAARTGQDQAQQGPPPQPGGPSPAGEAEAEPPSGIFPPEGPAPQDGEGPQPEGAQTQGEQPAPCAPGAPQCPGAQQAPIEGQAVPLPRDAWRPGSGEPAQQPDPWAEPGVRPAGPAQDPADRGAPGPQPGGRVPIYAQQDPAYPRQAVHPSTPPDGQEPVGLGEWMATMLLTALPLVNLVMLFLWAFGGTAKPSKRNWALAALVFMAIGLGLALVFGFMGALFYWVL